MTDYLLFSLYGPLAAWGNIAVGEVRGSDAHPSKSAILGLLSAALGIRRNEEERLAELAQGYGFASRVDAPGMVLRDYHTVQVAGRIDLKGRPRYTRRDELQVPREQLNTLLSAREYRADALYTIALWPYPSAPHDLATVAEALERPRFPLRLGRKSCPPALPLRPLVTTAADLVGALAEFDRQPECQAEAVWLRHLDTDKPILGWEGEAPAGVAALLTVTRHDQPRSRRRWQFEERHEHRGPWPRARRGAP